MTTKAKQLNGHSNLEGPRTVQAAKIVSLAIINYTDERGKKSTQLAIIGDNTVHLLEGKAMGLSGTATPQGRASDWLRDAVFEFLQES